MNEDEGKSSYCTLKLKRPANVCRRRRMRRRQGDVNGRAAKSARRRLMRMLLTGRLSWSFDDNGGLVVIIG